MKKTSFVAAFTLVAMILFVLACSDDENPGGTNPHPEGFGDSSSANFHGQLAACENCHGAQYRMSIAGASCFRCHPQQPSEALVACGTCHAIPPVSDAGLPSGMPPGTQAYGAHDYHVNTRGYACTECHLQNANEMIVHVDSLPGDMNFARAALAIARGFQASATHVGASNSGNATCAVYCHSNGRGGPPNMGWPEWTAQGLTFECTSCHGIPPAYPHPQVPTCHECHHNVDPASTYPGDIRFINPQLHIDGVVEL